MAQTSHTQERAGELKHGVLGLGDAFAQSFALLSLALASSLATSLSRPTPASPRRGRTSSPAPGACAWRR